MSDYSAVAPPQNFSQSSAFAAAIQRARQIAAKIHTVPGSEGGGKRPLEEGSEPESKKVAGVGSVNDPANPLRPPQAAGAGGVPAVGVAAAGQVAARVAGAGGGLGLAGLSEDIRVPDKMVGLIIGRGGEQISRLQTESKCKIQMAPDSGGLPDRVCSLSGTRESIARAKELINAIVQQRSRTEGNSMGGGGGGGGGPGGFGDSGAHSVHTEIMIPGPKVGLIIGKGGETIKQLQDRSGAKMTVIQDMSIGQEEEKPLRISGSNKSVEHAKALVYELIAEKEMQNAFRGDRRDDHFSDFRGGSESAEVLVPQAAVGVVIGKGGDMIKKIQNETGARVQFQQGRDDGPGERKCLLTGKDRQVQMARMRIEELIDSVLRRDNEIGRGRRGMGGPGGRPPYDGMDRGGEYGRDDRGWDQRRLGGPMGDKQEAAFTIQASKCGVVIGRGGETIKQINSQSGAHCEMDRRPSNNPNEKIILIRGNPEQIETAKRLIQDKLGMPLGQINGGPPNQYPMGQGPGGPPGGPGGPPGGPGGPGGPPQHYGPVQVWGGNQYQQWQQTQGHPSDPSAGNPVQVNPQTGQPDYSIQWVEYYRSVGMHREAEQIEQQAKGLAPAAQPQPQPQPAAAPQPQPTAQQPAAVAQNGQPDYSAQWADYYRSIGKLKEAEAIEAQMKATKAAQVQQPQQPGAAAPQQPGQGAPVQQPGYGQPYGYQAAAGYYGGGGPGGPQPPQQPGQPQYGYGNYSAYGGQPGGPEN